MITKRRHQHFATCDGCSAELGPEYDYLDMVASMKHEGWLFVRPNRMTSEWYHFCPICKARRRSNEGA